jgi:enoyl-CoA hydratase/carnithine racemase
MTYMYDMPDEIQVEADGPLRIITLNRPASLNAVNDALHTGLARLWPRLSEDREARCAVLTGAGRAFSAGGDLTAIRYCGPLPSATCGPRSTPSPVPTSRRPAPWRWVWPTTWCPIR